MKVQIIFKLLSIVGKHWVLIVWKISTHLVNEWISSGESDLWHFTKILSKNLFSKQYLQTSGSTWRSRKMWKSTSCMNTWKIHLYHSRRWVKTSWFMEESVLLMFSSRSFIVSSLIFRSLIYFEFIFVYGIRGRRKWQPIPVFLPGEFHRQRSLAGCSSWGCKESDMAERLSLMLLQKVLFILFFYI